MTTRRKVLTNSIRSAGLFALNQAAPGRWLLGQAAQQKGQHQDETTVNSAPAQAPYPRPDFGPPPKVLPQEAVAVSGPNSLKEHAARSGLISGSAVVVRVLLSDVALATLVANQCAILVPEDEL